MSGAMKRTPAARAVNADICGEAACVALTLTTPGPRARIAEAEAPRPVAPGQHRDRVRRDPAPSRAKRTHPLARHVGLDDAAYDQPFAVEQERRTAADGAGSRSSSAPRSGGGGGEAVGGGACGRGEHWHDAARPPEYPWAWMRPLPVATTTCGRGSRGGGVITPTRLSVEHRAARARRARRPSAPVSASPNAPARRRRASCSASAPRCTGTGSRCSR